VAPKVAPEMALSIVALFADFMVAKTVAAMVDFHVNLRLLPLKPIY
jgi:hypothetical protein